MCDNEIATQVLECPINPELLTTMTSAAQTTAVGTTVGGDGTTISVPGGMGNATSGTLNSREEPQNIFEDPEPFGLARMFWIIILASCCACCIIVLVVAVCFARRRKQEQEDEALTTSLYETGEVPYFKDSQKDEELADNTLANSGGLYQAPTIVPPPTAAPPDRPNYDVVPSATLATSITYEAMPSDKAGPSLPGVASPTSAVTYESAAGITAPPPGQVTYDSGIDITPATNTGVIKYDTVAPLAASVQYDANLPVTATASDISTMLSRPPPKRALPTLPPNKPPALPPSRAK